MVVYLRPDTDNRKDPFPQDKIHPDLAKGKVKARLTESDFDVPTTITKQAGALYAHFTSYIAPDVFVPGNHEFDFGRNVFLERMGEARFPLFAANLQGPDGKPLPGVEYRLLDDEGNDVELGDPGEIVVKGPNVFQGYWHRPEDTQRAFVDGGWFKTGDVAVVEGDRKAGKSQGLLHGSLVRCGAAGVSVRGDRSTTLRVDRARGHEESTYEAEVCILWPLATTPFRGLARERQYKPSS